MVILCVVSPIGTTFRHCRPDLMVRWTDLTVVFRALIRRIRFQNDSDAYLIRKGKSRVVIITKNQNGNQGPNLEISTYVRFAEADPR